MLNISTIDCLPSHDRYSSHKAARSRPTSRGWSKAHSFERLAAAYEYIHTKGGLVFTLRLNPAALIQVTGAADPTRTMSRRIQKAFKRRGLPVPMLAFALEVTRDDREELHLHGAIVLDGYDLPAVKNILREAGGTIVGRAAARQVQIKNFDLKRGGPIGWAEYPRKALVRTRRVIGNDKLIYIDRTVNRFAKLLMEQRPARLP